MIKSKYLRPYFYLLILFLSVLVIAPSIASNPNYVEALQKSIYFYEAQRSGALPTDNRVEWRGDSGLSDGLSEGVDLSGGWYDAGDHVKFGFPMAATTTMLAWGVVEYRQAYETSGQLPYILDNIRWATDYFIKAHTAPNELWGQVGDAFDDHAWWGPAEVMPMQRPAYKIDENCPGTDLAASTAAALAASAMIFSETDPSYAQKLLKHAVELYQFADKFRGRYSDCITNAQGFYPSKSYQDELVWGALWLYRATGEANYLEKARLEYQQFVANTPADETPWRWTQSWDNSLFGSYVLLAKLTGSEQYRRDTEWWLDYWSGRDASQRVHYTPDGLARLSEWGSLRYAANTSLLAMIYADYLAEQGSSAEKVARYQSFSKNQIDYMLGRNSANRSYMVGFGANFPLNPHHRTAHGSWTAETNVPKQNRHTLYGALVSGPGLNDEYEDNRDRFVMSEVSIGYNAGLTGALARLAGEYGGTLLENFPPPEVRDDEFFTEAKVVSSGTHFMELDVTVHNRSAWPAKGIEAPSLRYFIDLSEWVGQGFPVDDIEVTLTAKQDEATQSNIIPSDAVLVFQPWHVEKHIYSIEVSFSDTSIYPGGYFWGGEKTSSKREARFRLSLPENKGAILDLSNDWSFDGLTSARYLKTERIALYDNNEILWGSEPDKQLPVIEPEPESSEELLLLALETSPKVSEGPEVSDSEVVTPGVAKNGGGIFYGLLLLLSIFSVARARSKKAVL